ncbi:UPF0149 family protein [Devosia sp. CAU 1758]
MALQTTDLSTSLTRLEILLGEVDDAMLLSELDGFLCGVLVSPDPIGLDEWWPLSFLSDGRGVIDANRQELAALIQNRLAAMERELADGRFSPLYEVDEASGDIAWPLWLSGFEQAMQLRFDAWDELLRHPFQDVRGEAATRLATALLLAQPGFGPDDTASDADWAGYDASIKAIPENLAIAAMLFYQAHMRD